MWVIYYLRRNISFSSGGSTSRGTPNAEALCRSWPCVRTAGGRTLARWVRDAGDGASRLLHEAH